MSDDFHKINNPQEFKNTILEALSRPTAVPMLDIWWDSTKGFCITIGHDLKVNKEARKGVGTMLLKFVSDLKIFEEVGKKVD